MNQGCHKNDPQAHFSFQIQMRLNLLDCKFSKLQIRTHLIPRVHLYVRMGKEKVTNSWAQTVPLIGCELHNRPPTCL